MSYLKGLVELDDSTRVLVTGGVGFIGNSIVRKILENKSTVYVLDKFSSKNNLDDVENKSLHIIKGDCTIEGDLEKIPKQLDIVFHLAADPEVNLTITNPKSIFQNNILATYNLLEFLRKINCKCFVFTSTSTIYGEPSIFPTSETYSPCNPISLYGASKLACEAMISSYCHTYKKQGVIVRLANIIGPKSDHGIIPDMIKKSQNCSKTIEVLGDGTQTKSYLHVDDCVEGMLTILNNEKSLFSIYNLGSDTQILVNEIVDIILNECNLNHIKKVFTGGVDGGRGWLGDVKKMLLDINKIKRLGWSPKLNSREAVIKTVKQIRQQSVENF